MNVSDSFVRDFLFPEGDIHQDGNSIHARLHMDVHKEGWMGIPHGGIGMAAVMELISDLPHYPGREGRLYPVSAQFRMGGSSVRVGDTLDIAISEADGGVEAEVISDDVTFPYISSTISYNKDDPEKSNLFASYLPASFSAIESSLSELPYYKNCFVCGVERSAPGLKRRFFMVKDRSSQKYMTVAMAGFDQRDDDTFFLFQSDGFLHPIATIALLDETLGWAGFLASASGAVTVLIGYTFYRPIRAGEKIIFFGRVERVRGRPRARVMFWASGGAAVLKEDGRFEIVVAAHGQWMGIAELTDQMHRELMPAGLVDEVLRLTSAPAKV